MTCNHKDGWMINEVFVIAPDTEEPYDEHIVQCLCNHVECYETKKFKFDIVNVEEVK